ncbi:hypothetical protein LPJ66_007010 [Kickxella alabastrina]|uniref:Uncharacterized protein n=1 Tax=Kickxella alabastrina TaxID=61397 RepID=A0ACC1IBI7_9FUNG|nr:hypothetical protein LPJ66_007010 [Kickxella alabastrina]
MATSSTTAAPAPAPAPVLVPVPNKSASPAKHIVLRDSCPSSDPTQFPCEAGLSSYYIPQSSLECAHFICQVDSNTVQVITTDSETTQKKSVALPAVLGTIIPVGIIGAGVLFFLLRRRHKKQRAMDAQHEDARYMSSYNNLIDDSSANGARSNRAYSSTYSVSKWRDSAMRAPETPGSHASIPIIFSAEYNGDQALGYRETKLYNTGAQTHETGQWASPNVVNLKQKPQLVVLGGNATTFTGTGLGVDTTNVQVLPPGGQNSSTQITPDTPLTPEAPFASAVSDMATPVTPQMPSVAQVNRLQGNRAIESVQNQDQPAPGSPLRVLDNGWDSDADGPEYYSESEGSGSDAEESDSESEESDSDSEESGSDSEESGSDSEESGSEAEESGSGSSESSSDIEDGEGDANDDEDAEESSAEASDDHSESEDGEEYDSDSQGDGEHGGAPDDGTDASDEEYSESELESEAEAESELEPQSKQLHQNQLTLGPELIFDSSDLDLFSSDLLSAAQNIGAGP